MLVGIGSTVNLPCAASGSLSASGPYGDKTNTPCVGNVNNLTADELNRYFEIIGLGPDGLNITPFFSRPSPNNVLFKAGCGNSRINRLGTTKVRLNLARNIITFEATDQYLLTSAPGSDSYHLAYAVWNGFINNVRYLSVPFDIVTPCGPAVGIRAERISPSQVQLEFVAALVRIEKFDGTNWILVVDNFVGTAFVDTIDPTDAVPPYRIFSICNLSGQDYLSVAGYINVYQPQTFGNFRPHIFK